MSALNELYDELEHTFRDNSEVLITSLALRDEQEYEKELKNQFISLLLGVQKKRQMNKKRYATNKKQKSTTGAEPGTVSGVHVGQPSTLRLLLLLVWAGTFKHGPHTLNHATTIVQQNSRELCSRIMRFSAVNLPDS